MKIAFMFPGQGSQYTGMGKDFYETFEESKKVFDLADDLLCLDMKQLIFEPNEKLSITEYTQAAMITVIAAMLAPIKKMNIPVAICAGLSLGEYAALIMNEALTVEDALVLVRKRGIFMQQEVPPQEGKMAAVLGISSEKVTEVLAMVDGIVSIANDNCPGQVVISGETKAVDAAGVLLEQQGAKRVLPLNVSGPFHSMMLKGAGEKLAVELDQVTIHPPVIPYVANVTAKAVQDETMIKDLLSKQVFSPVYWQQSVKYMIDEGIDTFVEIGPGKTLSSFVKKIDRTKKVITINTVDDLKQLEQIIEERI